MTRSPLRAATLLVPVLLHAQSAEPRGAVPDARPLPAGAFRLALGTSWDRRPEEYRNGILSGLGARFSIDSIGPSQVALLAPAEAATRVASGLAAFRASLGRSVVQARTEFDASTLRIEYGLTSRVTVGAAVPFVTASAWTSVAMNPLGREATVGVNPAWTVAGGGTANALLLQQFDSATAFLSRQLASCPSHPAASGCAAILADPAGARAINDQASAFTAALATLFGGRNGSRGAVFVPVGGSAALSAIAARVAGYRTQFATFGAPAISAAAPGGAAPVTAAGLNSLLSDSLFGIRANPLAPTVRRGTGNAEFTASALVYDGRARGDRDGGWRRRLWWRASLGGTYRLAHTDDEPAADLLPLPIGGAGALTARANVDVGIGSRLSLTSVLAATSYQAVTQRMRSRSSADDPFPEAFREASVTTTPGQLTAVELYPRWIFTDAVSMSGIYAYRSAAADAMTGRISGADPTGAVVTADAAGLGQATGGHEQRLGVTLSYSTVESWRHGTAAWPLELMLRHYQTTTGGGADVAKVRYDEVELRWYWRLRR